MQWFMPIRAYVCLGLRSLLTHLTVFLRKLCCYYWSSSTISHLTSHLRLEIKGGLLVVQFFPRAVRLGIILTLVGKALAPVCATRGKASAVLLL